MIFPSKPIFHRQPSARKGPLDEVPNCAGIFPPENASRRVLSPFYPHAFGPQRSTNDTLRFREFVLVKTCPRQHVFGLVFPVIFISVHLFRTAKHLTEQRLASPYRLASILVCGLKLVLNYLGLNGFQVEIVSNPGLAEPLEG